jgi:hypothetical protein
VEGLGRRGAACHTLPPSVDALPLYACAVVGCGGEVQVQVSPERPPHARLNPRSGRGAAGRGAGVESTTRSHPPSSVRGRGCGGEGARSALCLPTLSLTQMTCEHTRPDHTPQPYSFASLAAQ